MPKAFEVGDVLPATTQLKIAFDIDNNDFGYNIANDSIEGAMVYMADWYEFAIVTRDTSDFPLVDYKFSLLNGGKLVYSMIWHQHNMEIESVTWGSVCGDNGNSPCGTDKWVIIDTSDWPPNQRTIHELYYSNVFNLTYEDLDPQEEPTGTSNITVNNSPLKSSHAGSNPIAKIYVNNALIYDVASQGGEETIPEGTYVIFENEDGSTISVTPNWTQSDVEIQYSFNGSDWSSATAETEIENTTGNQIAFRGKAPTDKRLFTDILGTNAWVCANTTKITGNLNFLLCDDFGDETAPTTLADYCYTLMFYECTSLTTAPSLPATTLAVSCYGFMFGRCTSLTTAPSLPATILENSCYSGMFYECTSLTTAPSLPATTIAFSCYSRMFRDCTSLTTAPSLPATTLEISCYRKMFDGCSIFKVSATDTGDYIHAWRIPTEGTGTTASDWNKDMLSGTTGTFTDDPEIDTTYYIENEPV